MVAHPESQNMQLSLTVGVGDRDKGDKFKFENQPFQEFFQYTGVLKIRTPTKVEDLESKFERKM